MNFTDLNLINYQEALKIQTEKFEASIKAKKAGAVHENHLLFCEHPHVFTLGRNGEQKNLLVGLMQMQQKHAEYYEIGRGGDITYHGPGQLVGYPIFDLDSLKIGLKDYIHKLEQVIINSLAELGIKSQRLDGATGVWLDVKKNPRKICAIGVQCKSWVTMHGFALNVNTDLSYFDMINPCGFTDKKVTSIEKELGEKFNFAEIKRIVKHNLIKEFNL
jgi:lipoyl(octanoyl) transferase